MIGPVPPNCWNIHLSGSKRQLFLVWIVHHVVGIVKLGSENRYIGNGMLCSLLHFLFTHYIMFLVVWTLNI